MPSGRELEGDVQQIYSYLLNMKDEGIVVALRASLIGRTGTRHEMDVYYCFERAGVRHQVGIECKDLKKAASLKEVRDFDSKLRDIGNIVGIFVSRNGLQRGAQKFANEQRIITLRFDELPSLRTLIADRIQSIAFPEPDAVGQPFWTIMEMMDGKLTGSYYALQDGDGGLTMPLTFSRGQAKSLYDLLGLDSNRWQIRGLPQYSLRAFILLLELQERRGGANAAIVAPTSDGNIQRMTMTSSALRSEYLIGYGAER